jgi:hypothetical protein
MGSNWEVVASCVSAGMAVLALLLSLRQGRMANRQSLFDRRLKIWITVEKLAQVYQDNASLLEQGDEPQFAVDLCFEWLTNASFLQEITPVIAHPLDAGYQLKLHLKLDEMKALSAEASFVFKGAPKKAIAEFIDAYQALLFSMYRYQIVLNAMQSDASKFHWSLDESAKRLGERSHRIELYNAEDRLAAAHKQITGRGVVGKVRRQIRLDSTLADYISTFR